MIARGVVHERAAHEHEGVPWRGHSLPGPCRRG